MALETKIPTEIESYTEKLVFGLSARQLICLTGAAATAIGTWLILTGACGVSSGITSYIIMAEAIPIMAIGFLRRDGLPFERYVSLLLRQILRNNIFYNKTGDRYVQSISTQTNNRPKTEYTAMRTETEWRIRKNSKARIRAARRQFRRLQQSQKKQQ